MRKTAALLCVVALCACGSKKKKPAGESARGSASTGSAAETSTPVVGQMPAAADLVWNEVSPPPKSPVARHGFYAPPPSPPPADPDAVIARYKAECPKGTASDTCKDLELQVERILLDDIVGLRSAQVPVDRQWYLVAARAHTPQLACLGVHALAVLEKRSPEEDAAVLAAFDHPAPSVRWQAYSAGLPATAAMGNRAVPYDRSMIGTCLDGHVDREYGIKWAGGYPNAKYRFFASTPTQRWFTTTDSLEKVTAFFTKQGHPPLTESDAQAQSQQKLVAEITKITQTMKEDEVDKANAQVVALSSKYSVPLLHVAQAEIRYVMLTSNIDIAIFKDDVMNATSIVALAPPGEPEDMTEEGLNRRMLVEEIYGHDH
jgi:hypothetical protein